MRKYSLALLLLPACLVYACGGGDDSAGNNDGGGSEGGGQLDGTVGSLDGTVPGVDGSMFGTDSGAKDGGAKDGSGDGSKDANDGAVVFDGNYPYPLPDGAVAVFQWGGTGKTNNPITDVEFIDGLQWVPQFGAVLVSDAELVGTGTLYKYTIDAAAPVQMPGYGINPIGNALLADAGFFSGSETGKLYFSPLDGGPPVVFSATFGGTRYNQPNDAVVRNDGFIYMTDPNYSGDQQGGTSVFLVRPDGGTTTVVGPSAAKTEYNGIALSPDQKTLYVSITNDTFGLPSNIMKYTVAADGSLGVGTQFITADAGLTRNGGVDGITCDDAGNVYVAVVGGVEIYNPAGAFIGFITLSNRNVSSLAFGGADRRTLFIAANDPVANDGKSALYRIYMNVPGGPTK